MSLKANYQKFKIHLNSGGLRYAIYRGLKYFIFLLKEQRNRFKQDSSISMRSGRAKIICTSGGVRIFWDNYEVSQSPGVNVAVNTLGLWTNSTEAEWMVLVKGKDYYKFKVVFRNLPLSQFWYMRIVDEHKIDIQIDTEIEEWLHIEEFRICCLVNPRYKAWVSGYQEGDFLRPDKRWQDVYVDTHPVSLVGVRFATEGAFLPSVAIETGLTCLLPLIQNPPSQVNAHIIGLRHIDPEGKKGYEPGVYHLFSGRINLFEDNHLLDVKTEKLRQDYVKTTMEKKAKIKTKKKLKILLVNLPWQRQGVWGVRAGSRWPHIKDSSEDDYLPFPFFLSYATSLLQKYGIEAALIDAIAQKIPEDKFLEMILKKEFDYIVAETSIPSFYYDLYLLKKIASVGIPIILCGPNASIYQPQFLKEYPFISFVLFGEYEFSLLELIKSLQERSPFSKVNGLIYHTDGSVKKNPARALFDINLLPWPYREGLPMDKYLDAPGEMRTPSVQMQSSRGCPFKCQFCLWPQVMYQGNRYRTRDVKDVIDEMEYLVKEKGFKSVYFDDDTFNVGRERMLSFCKQIRERGLAQTQWAIMARPDLMDEEILENMKASGLWAIKYGVESATQGLVDAIGKDMDLKKSEAMIKFTKQLGIRTHLTFTFGLLGETKETIEKTIRYTLKLDPFSVQFSITTPFPGTEYYRILEKQDAIVEKDFSYYDGHYKSVIKLDNLNPEDLEIAKKRAYRMWLDHLRRRRGFWGDVKRFCVYTQDKGLGYSLHKAGRYLGYLALKRKDYLKS